MKIEEAIEILKNSKCLYLKEKIDSDILEEAIKTLLTAYEKQQKELKDLKDIQQKICNEELFEKDYVEKLQKEIEELKEKYKNLNWYFENQKDNFVHKDKIKAKIDLIDKEYADIIEKNKNDLYLVNINAQRHDAMQVVLQELLEKE